MLRLTDQIGKDVIDGAGAKVGVIRDMAAPLSPRYPTVSELLVRRGRQRLLFAASSVASFGESNVRLRDSGTEPSERQLEDDRLLLSRDLLDAQVVDVEGKRLVRVADVELSERGSELRLAGVDVGVGSLLRRLGLGGLVPNRLSHETVDWAGIEIVSMRGHSIQLRAGHGLDTRTPEQIAELVARMPPTHGARILARVEPDRAGEAISTLPATAIAATLGGLEGERRQAVLESLPADKASEVAELLERRAPARHRHRSRFGKILSARRHAPS